MKQNPIEQFHTVINQNSAHIIIHLTLYHKIPTFNYPGKLPYDNIVAKGEMLVTSIFSFYHVFCSSQKEFLFSFTFILSSANTFNLD